ncbi:MAG: Gfo/Idh/MocA family oxidoreductase [Spirochaetes bacterium]|nr:Gfo/Idh/MocA family oxidoreductase [Spirochaetota bacterium]
MKHKIIVAGCGSMSKAWIEHAKTRDDAEIVGFMDIRKESAEAAAQKFAVSAPAFTDLAEAIRATGASIVFDVTIPAAHKKTVLTALNNGCHVFGEKPMADSLPDARTMTNAAVRAKKTYAVMQNRRYLKNIRAFRETLTSGKIGTPGFFTADFFIGAHFGGFRDAMESPLVLDMAIHTFDQARFIIGADPVAVYCREFNPPGSWYKGAAAAVCTFEFENGIMFSYRGSWCAEGLNTSWEAVWRVTGSSGSAIWEGSGMPYGETVVPSAEKKFKSDTARFDVTPGWNGREGHNGCLDEMFSALNEGRSPETVCTDNIKSVAMVFAAIESSRKGKRVHVRF